MNAPKQKKVLITGATGLVGQHLIPLLFEKNYEVHILARNLSKAKELYAFPIHIHQWDAISDEAPEDILKKTDVLINLIGEGIADKRWTHKRKALLQDSRIIPTQKLTDALKKSGTKVENYIGASAIGYYKNLTETEQTEEQSAAPGFLGSLCKKWEDAGALIPANRHCHLRIGIVLAQDGGALKSMLPAFRLGLGGELGHGKQWMSWIHVEDLCSLIIEAIENPKLNGPVNAVAPNPIRNAEFTRAISNSLHRPAVIPVPKFGILALFGELSTIMLSSQKISSKKAVESGFTFQFPHIQEALDNILKPNGIVGAFRLPTVQWFSQDQSEVFAFFSEAKNLERITPPWLNFKIVKMSTPQIENQTLLDYRLKLHGVPLKWQTLIESWSPDKKFVDRQLKGPYSVWHHTHSFSSLRNGTLVKDEVIYKIPFGRLGELVRDLWVKHDLQKIFSFRQRVLEKVYGA